MSSDPTAAATRSMIYVGMDVHKESITIAVRPESVPTPSPARHFAVDDQEDAQHGTVADQQQALLTSSRVVRIGYHEREIVGEDGFRLLETDSVFAQIRASLGYVPIEAQVSHTGNVRTTYMGYWWTVYVDRDVSRQKTSGPKRRIQGSFFLNKRPNEY